MIQMPEKASEQKKKKLHFCRSKMASHARPQRLLHVTVGFQRTHETSPRCGGATVPPCNHSGCPTTPSKAILKHMTTPYGTLYQISNFPREQNTIILNRPRDKSKGREMTRRRHDMNSSSKCRPHCGRPYGVEFSAATKV